MKYFLVARNPLSVRVQVEDAMAAAGADAAVDPNATADAAVAGTVFPAPATHAILAGSRAGETVCGAQAALPTNAD